eukprot:CAMPEP_0113630246 /NCGR_PEP_ID=MMETSP0017_2-20120614/15712_1 /TAXON_ID=2856 /ORGANISM="Cylindrotheca closterium" /LENGTH=64 /DNA_ID=CAMNT_0000540697 /DNA_START=957 /DNA_END=1151 /DNA_ORIENTATION=- /assembly_acc=CAM_ASM_000147
MVKDQETSNTAPYFVRRFGLNPIEMETWNQGFYPSWENADIPATAILPLLLEVWAIRRIPMQLT